jgi:hypothetical protein
MGFAQNTEEAPLTEALLEHNVILEEGQQPSPDLAQSSSLDSTWNLTNVILGAGEY